MFKILFEVGVCTVIGSHSIFCLLIVTCGRFDSCIVVVVECRGCYACLRDIVDGGTRGGQNMSRGE